MKSLLLFVSIALIAICLLSHCQTSSFPAPSGTWFSAHMYELHEDDTTYLFSGVLIDFKTNNTAYIIGKDTIEGTYKTDRSNIKVFLSDILAYSGKITSSSQFTLMYRERTHNRHMVFAPLRESFIPADYPIIDSLKNGIWKINHTDSVYTEFILNNRITDDPTIQFQERNELITTNAMFWYSDIGPHWFISFHDVRGVQGTVLLHFYQVTKEGYKVEYFNVNDFGNYLYHNGTLYRKDSLNRLEYDSIRKALTGSWYAKSFPDVNQFGEDKIVVDTYFQITLLQQGQFEYKSGGIIGGDMIIFIMSVYLLYGQSPWMFIWT